MMKRTNAYLLTILLVAGGDCAAAAGAEIQLRSQCQAAGNVVVLGDVAQVHAADSQQTDELCRLELFPAPAVGSRRYVRLREVQDLLERRGVSLAGQSFSGASMVLVTGGEVVEATAPPQRQVTVSERNRTTQLIREAIVRYLEKQASAVEAWIVEVDLDDQQVRQLGGGALAVTVSGGQAPWSGQQRFTIETGGAAIDVSAEVSTRPAVVVAVRSLPRGATVGPGDVTLERDITLVSGKEGLTRLDEVIGQQTTQAIAAGKPLDREAIRSPVVVKRNEIVTVFVRAAGVQVKAQGRARDDGSVGDVIEIESLLDRKRYLARVSGIQEAEVYARAASADDDKSPTKTAAGEEQLP
jgi:flagella basal body P-ring formation protein FlgA